MDPALKGFAMKWTRPIWSVSVDLVGHGIALLVVLVVAGISRLLG